MSEWCLSLYFSASESCVRLFDIDEDGRDDIIIGTALSGIIANARVHRKEMKVHCQEAS